MYGYFNPGVIWLAFVIIYVISGIIFGVVCKSIVASKGYDDKDNNGFAWGFFLGIIGLIVCCVKPSVLQQNQRMIPRTWVCSCGAVNDLNLGDYCMICGKKKPDNKSTQTDATSEIKKYKQLLDEGIITQEDFEAKKKQLLGL